MTAPIDAILVGAGHDPLPHDVAGAVSAEESGTSWDEARERYADYVIDRADHAARGTPDRERAA